MAIEDTNNKVVGICTQSTLQRAFRHITITSYTSCGNMLLGMLLNWIKNHMSDLGTGKNAKIEELRPYQYGVPLQSIIQCCLKYLAYCLAFPIRQSRRFEIPPKPFEPSRSWFRAFEIVAFLTSVFVCVFKLCSYMLCNLGFQTI